MGAGPHLWFPSTFLPSRVFLFLFLNIWFKREMGLLHPLFLKTILLHSLPHRKLQAGKTFTDSKSLVWLQSYILLFKTQHLKTCPRLLGLGFPLWIRISVFTKIQNSKELWKGTCHECSLLSLTHQTGFAFLSEGCNPDLPWLNWKLLEEKNKVTLLGFLTVLSSAWCYSTSGMQCGRNCVLFRVFSTAYGESNFGSILQIILN